MLSYENQTVRLNVIYHEITKDNIELFVKRFYENAIENEQIGHFFTNILGEDLNNKAWQEHMDILIDFWSSMVLKEENYTGSAFAPHAKMKLCKADFTCWQKILDNTLDEFYDTKNAEQFKEIGIVMSKNFLRRLDT